MANERPHVPRHFVSPTIGILCTENTATLDSGEKGIKQGLAVTSTGAVHSGSVALYAGPALFDTRKGEMISVPQIGSTVLVRLFSTADVQKGDPLTLNDGYYDKAVDSDAPIVAWANEDGENGALILATLCDVRYASVSD